MSELLAFLLHWTITLNDYVQNFKGSVRTASNSRAAHRLPKNLLHECCTDNANAVSNTNRKQQWAHQNDQEGIYRYKPTMISESQDLESVKLTSQYWNIRQMWWFNDITLYCDNQKLLHVHSHPHIHISNTCIYRHIFICGGVYMYF